MVNAQLRILQTTDLHMHMLQYDYAADQVSDRVGLIGLLPMIQSARASDDLCLLFDTGDFLQGTPLADQIAGERDAAEVHPIVKSFNDLRYDAITLGNHEFDYGLDYLTQVLSDCDMPVVCANARIGPTKPLVAPWTILNRDVRCSDGRLQQIRIGVIGFLTPQVVDWNAHVLNGRLQTDDILAAARSNLPALRRAGADIIIALCHAGISEEPVTRRMENPAVPLAAMPDIDVVLAGHTHDIFPAPDGHTTNRIDHTNGTLHGKPSVMAHAFGAALGEINLSLSLTADGWQIVDHTVDVRRPNGAPPTSAAQRAMQRRLAADQSRTLDYLRYPVCKTPRRLTSYLGVLGADDTAPLLARAQLSALEDGLKNTEFADIPILASTSSYRAGGHSGPSNYVDIPAGAISLRHISAIVPFNNPLIGVLRRGWQVKNWLERSSQFFNSCRPGTAVTALINDTIPAYHFDTLHGLRYRIDLSKDPVVESEEIGPRRVRDVTYDGQAVADDALFVVATTSYRARGGGGLADIQPHDIIYSSAMGLADIFTDDLRRSGVPATPPRPNWNFVPQPNVAVSFSSAPAASALIAHDERFHVGTTDQDGFCQYTLTL